MFGALQRLPLFQEINCLTFIGDHTHLSWVYLMHEKSKVEQLFKDFYKMVETQFQTKISILHVDNGTEYFNEHLGNFVKETGIQHQSTYIDTPQQNGIAERKNKHLLSCSCNNVFHACS